MKKELRATSGLGFNASTLSPKVSLNTDNIHFIKVHELQMFKKEQAKRLGKLFVSMSALIKKTLLKKVAAALFGETAYEIEVARYEQAYRKVL
jgi:hypothetical protein